MVGQRLASPRATRILRAVLLVASLVMPAGANDVYNPNPAVPELSQDLEFSAAAIPFNERDPARTSAPTSVPGGSLEWRGGFNITFTGSPEAASGLAGGWSGLTGGSSDGTNLWIITDNDARLLKVELETDAGTAFMARVVSITNVSWSGGGDGGTRVDAESLISLTAKVDDLDDFVVGMEVSSAFAPNSLVRFAGGRAGRGVEVPGSQQAMVGNRAQTQR
jgi:hypothetical protein